MTFPPAYQRAAVFTTPRTPLRPLRHWYGAQDGATHRPLPGDCFSVFICDCVLQVSRHNTTNAAQPPRMARIVERNVAALLEERKNEEKALTFSERVAERILRRS